MSKERIKRPQTAGEEIANTISHGLGALLALAGAIPLVDKGRTDRLGPSHRQPDGLRRQPGAALHRLGGIPRGTGPPG